MPRLYKGKVFRETIFIFPSKSYILDVSRPAAGEHDWTPSVIQGLGHVGVACLVNGLRGIAAIKLQHVHAPCCEGVGIVLDVTQCARIASTCVRTKV